MKSRILLTHFYHLLVLFPLPNARPGTGRIMTGQELRRLTDNKVSRPRLNRTGLRMTRGSGTETTWQMARGSLC